MPPRSATKPELEELRSELSALKQRFEASQQTVEQLESEKAALRAARDSAAALTEHLQLLHRNSPTVDFTRLIFKDWKPDKLPEGDNLPGRLRGAMLAAEPALKGREHEVCFIEGHDDASTPVRKSGDLDGTPVSMGTLVVIEFPRALYPRLLKLAKQLLKGYGIVVAPYLTPYGAALRRLRQPVYEQLRREGRNPQWRDGARILISGPDGKGTEFWKFPPLE